MTAADIHYQITRLQAAIALAQLRHDKRAERRLRAELARWIRRLGR